MLLKRMLHLGEGAVNEMADGVSSLFDKVCSLFKQYICINRVVI